MPQTAHTPDDIMIPAPRPVTSQATARADAEALKLLQGTLAAVHGLCHTLSWFEQVEEVGEAAEQIHWLEIETLVEQALGVFDCTRVLGRLHDAIQHEQDAADRAFEASRA